MGQLTKNEIFALAVQRYSDTVFRAAMHNCSCTADAEDVVQDVFEKLLCYNGRFESEEHLKAWLLRVTINRCHDLTRAARQKDTELDENLPAPDQMEDGSVEFHCEPKAGAWIRRAGCDIDIGQTVLKRGDRLTPPALGVAASIGVSTVKVYRPIRVSLFFTGDELAMPGEKLVEGGIYNSNRFVLRGLLHQLGCDVVDYGNIPDTFEATLEAFRKASRKSDFILTSGGMSVGEADFIRRAVEELGKMQMWRIAMKPGKPVAKGEVRGVPFIGLPGNPVSGFVTFLLFAQPLILKLSGRSQIDVKGYILPLAFDYKCGSRREFIRVRRNGAGELENYRTQNSAVLSSCTWADGLADIPAEADLKKGDLVTYIPFTEFNL